jgi:hypothetical protein
LAGVAVIAVAVLGAGAMWRARRHPATPPTAAAAPPPKIPDDVRAPDSVRVRVQVLNGTKVRGLARRATVVLRDRGFDVVEMGTDRNGGDTTIVYDLTGHPDWAQRVARVLAPARVVARPDSSRYLDVAVVLGTAWRPPAEAFYP